MNALTIPRTVLGAEYSVLRLPLTVLETQVVGRYLDEESPVRLTFEKALGSLDATVGRVLGDAGLLRRGSALARRTEILKRAVVLEGKAAARKQEADVSLKQAKKAADRKRADAQHRAQTDAQQIHEAQQAEKRAAEEKAVAEAQARIKAAEREAEARLELVDAETEQRVEAIEARKEARIAKPKAALKEASELRTDAARERKTAARLSDLADAEKASRKTS